MTQTHKHSPLIEVQNLRVEIGGKNILHDVSLSIEQGEIVTLIGPNGAGKSSLVRVMVGVIAPQSGRINRSPDLKIGYLPQYLQTAQSMPMRVSRFLKGQHRVSAHRRAQIIEDYGIGELLEKPLARLSGGEMRRVLFAHALLDDPNLLILDEPTAGLDIHATARFYEFIEKLRDDENVAILLVSHDLNVVMRASDRVVCLNGHICCQGAPMDVSNSPEYTELMGVFDPLTIYEHHHDHSHDH